MRIQSLRRTVVLLALTSGCCHVQDISGLSPYSERICQHGVRVDPPIRIPSDGKLAVW